METSRQLPRHFRKRKTVLSIVVRDDFEAPLEDIARNLGEISETMTSIADLLYRTELRS